MERFKFDAVSKTLTITSGYAKKLNDMESAEFKHYNAMIQAIPGLVVVNKTHQSPSRCTSKSTGETFKCNQFKNLKYENMERFMSALPNSEEYFAEYNFLRTYASQIQTSGYTLVRRWFVAQFPHFRKNPLFYIYNTPTLVKASEILSQEAEEVIQNKAA